MALPHAPHVRAVVSPATGHIFVAGLAATRPNATDAYDSLGALLRPAKSDPSLALNCRFYMRDGPAMIQQLYAGFHDVFNVAHYPPPTRTEFAQAVSDACVGCAVVVKCDAAMSDERVSVDEIEYV